MERPEKLFHATPTRNLETILREGLEGSRFTTVRDGVRIEAQDPVNLSTEDETDLVAFLGYLGCVNPDTDEIDDTITLLEIDVTGLPLTWPGLDGPHHYECHQAISPDRIRVVSTCGLDRVRQAHRGEPVTAEVIGKVFEAMDAAAEAHEARVTLE